MKRFAFFALLSVLCPLASYAQAVPQVIRYQGRLLNGTNLVNGNIGLSLRLYDAPTIGTLLYEDSNTVAVADGLYATSLGDNTTAGTSLRDALLTSPVYVEVRVNGTPLSPRELLGSVGYAILPGLRGSGNVESGLWAAVSGGYSNRVLGADYATIAGGRFNAIFAAYEASATISGGERNTIEFNGLGCSIAGGQINTIRANSFACAIGGGYGNTIASNSRLSVISGGDQNFISASDGVGINSIWNTIGGGLDNGMELTGGSTISGGGGNRILTHAFYATIGGGQANTIQSNAQYGAIGGGTRNTIQSNTFYAVIGGGDFNTVHPGAFYSTLAGGSINQVFDGAWFGAIGGGSANAVSANTYYATVPGGAFNVAGGSLSLAAGYRAKANHLGSFVWADSTEADFVSTTNDQFLIRASGGVGIGITNPASALHVRSASSDAEISVQSGDTNSHRWTIQASSDSYGGSLASSFQIIDRTVGSSRVLITTNGLVGIGIIAPTSTLHVAGTITCTTLNQTSDRNAKENFAPVDANAVLEKIAAMPVTRWNFKTEPAVQHVGPMAQDFHAVFGLGPNDTTIATVDEGGVALAAIQGLYKIVQEQQARIDRLEAELKSR